MINNILFVYETNNGMGDIVIHNTLIREFKKFFPFRKIYVVISNHLKFLIENNPNIDGIYTHEDNSKIPPWMDTICPRSFNNSTDKFMSKYKACLRITNNYTLCDYQNYNTYIEFLDIDNTKEVDKQLKFLEFFGIYNYNNSLVYYRGNTPKKFWCKYKYIIFSLSSSKYYKRWDKYNQLSKLEQFKKYKIILIGGDDVLEYSKKITGVNIINLVGKTNIDETYDVIDCCEFLIGNDSLPIHLSVSLDKPTLSLSKSVITKTPLGDVNFVKGFMPDHYIIKDNIKDITINELVLKLEEMNLIKQKKKGE